MRTSTFLGRRLLRLNPSIIGAVTFLLAASLGFAQQNQSIQETGVTVPLETQNLEVQPGEGGVDEARFPLGTPFPTASGFLPSFSQGTGQSNAFPSFDDSGQSELSPLQKKATRNINIRPSFGASAIYDTNVGLTHNNPESDLILSASAGLILEVGDYIGRQNAYLALAYGVTGEFYVNGTEENALNQSFSLAAQLQFTRLTIGMVTSYAYDNGSQQEVGATAKSNTINNTITASYELTGKINLAAAANTNIQLFGGGFESTIDNSFLIGLDYTLTGKLKAGPAFEFGLESVQGGSTQTYQNYLLRANLESAEKLTLRASGGIEIRQYNSPGVDDSISPIFGLGATWKPFFSTSVGFDLTSGIEASNEVSGLDTYTTSATLVIQQRFMQRFYLSMGFRYENDAYFGAVEGASSNRVDNYVGIRPAVSFELTQLVSATIFFETGQNFSTQNQNSYEDTQVGINLALAF